MRTTQYDTDNRYANVQHEPRIVHDRLQELLRLDIDTTNPDYRAQFDSFPHIILHSMEKDTNTSLRKHIWREHLTYLHILLHSLFSAVSYQNSIEIEHLWKFSTLFRAIFRICSYSHPSTWQYRGIYLKTKNE